jgi:hypothetical protein
VAVSCDYDKEVVMVTTIGIDPQKATHTAVAINQSEPPPPVDQPDLRTQGSGARLPGLGAPGSQPNAPLAGVEGGQ